MESMGTRCRTRTPAVRLACPPTFWVGDSGTTSSGWSRSSSFSSRMSASYSASEMTGASWS